MATIENFTSTPIWSVLGSTGEFVKKCDKDTPRARSRTYKDRDTEAEVTKYELVAKKITGTIKGIDVVEGNFGRQLMLNIDDEIKVAFSLSGANDQFAVDLMKKIPNIDMSKEVSLSPYCGEKSRIVFVKQGEADVLSAYDKFENGKFVSTNDNMPKADMSKSKSKSYWTEDYFPMVRKFLVSEIEKHELFGKKSEEPLEKIVYPKDDVSVDDIPF